MDLEKMAVVEVPSQIYEQSKAEELRDAIAAARTNGALVVRLDCSNCIATSSYALNLLAMQHSELKVAGGKLELFRVRGELREVLSYVLFDLVVPIAD